MSDPITEEDLDEWERFYSGMITVKDTRGGKVACRLIAEVRRLRERDGQWITAAQQQGAGIERRDAKIEEQAKEIERLREDNPGWQPIETAPKDGTHIDLFGTRNNKPMRFPDGRWTEDVWGGQPLGTFSWSHRGWDIYGRFEYTHWGQIPAPPQGQEDPKTKLVSN